MLFIKDALHTIGLAIRPLSGSELRDSRGQYCRHRVANFQKGWQPLPTYPFIPNLSGSQLSLNLS